MSLFDASIAALNAGLKQVGGVTVTVRRGNDSIDDLVVVPLQTRHDGLGDESGVAISARDHDWLVWADDYAFAGEVSEPAVGDEFDLIDRHGVTRTYQLTVREPDDRCYRFTDQTKLQLRVYTVEALPNTE